MKNSTPPTTCMDEYDPNALSVSQAKVAIQQAVDAIKSEQTIAIQEALMRVLAHDVSSPINVPDYTNSAMDGYAFNSATVSSQDKISLQIVGTVFAGQPLEQKLETGQCARIMTGGKIPMGCDTVIMQEHVTRDNNTITFDSQHCQSGQNVRHIGEDILKNTVILNTGRALTPADIGLLASVGIAEITVYRRVKVALFSTGDELVPVGHALKPGQLHDSNRYTLNALLTQFGADILDLGVIRDQPEKIEAAFTHAANEADILITSGGVSVGDADFVKSTLEKLGKVNFWKIAMKPGRPLAFGHLGQCHFFGLPGNPVSAMVTFYQFVLPALKRMSGQTQCEPLILQATCTTKLTKRAGRLEYQRGILENDNNGTLTVRSTGAQGSHILSSMSYSNCFIILPETCEQIESGTPVDVQPFSGFL